MSNPDIFERFAAKNQQDNFSSVTPITPVKTQPVNAINDSSKLKDVEGDIFDRFATKEKEKKQNQFGFLDTLKDIGQQVVAKGVGGIGGAYGNILDTFGLQLKEGQKLPGEEVRQSQQQQVLEKLNRGIAPSLGELMLLSDDEVLPSYERLPTSKEIESGIESVTGVGEGKTPSGRIAGRGAGFAGEGLATGGGLKAIAGLAGSGLAGQGIREAGGPEGLAAATEIVGSIAPSMISEKLIPSSQRAKDLVNAGRSVGLTESQITPLIQGEKKLATLSKVARKGSKTKELFSSIKDSLGDSYQSIKNSVSNMGNVNASNRQILIDKFAAIRNDLSKTLKPSPDKEAAINFISDAIKKVSKNGASPEELINFWQDINKSVKWNSIQGGKKSLTRLKEPILEVLNNVAPQAAKDFEMTNDLYSKYSQIAKKLKPDLIDSFISKGEILAAPAAGLALAQGNPWALIALGSETAIRLLGREMLINPYFQNIGKKLVTNFNQGSLKGVTESVKQVQEYMQRKHPNEDFSFLTRDKES